MNARTLLPLIAIATLAAPRAGTAAAPDALTAPAAQGAVIWAQRCSACHDHPVDRIPPRVFISTTRTAEDVIDTLTLGAMRPQASGLSSQQIRSLAVYLTGKEPAPRAAADANRCSRPIELHGAAGDWRSWGRDVSNSRFHPDSGLAAAQVPHLQLRWTFAYPGRAAFGQPAVLGNVVVAGGTAGRVFALDLASGCTYWSYEAGALVRTGILIGQVSAAAERSRWVAWFGDDSGTLHAVNMRDGSRLWTRSLDPHPMARLMGTPQLHDGVVYATVSSLEEVAAADPKYRCCTFRGSVVALDAASGRQLWHSYTIRQPPAPYATADGRQLLGPAGGAVFDAVTLDVGRGRLYVGTGDSYTNVASDSADAVLALSLRDGARLWTHQVLAGDAWILLCPGQPANNCPSPLGPDFDFSSSPMLMKLADGKQVLIAGSKSGIVYALDPLRGGKSLWQRELAHGSPNGAILWGPANDGARAYIATSSYDVGTGSGPGALTALDPVSGHTLWSTATPESPCAWGTRNCAHALLAGVTVIPGVVFAGAMDGHIRAYDARDGHVLWQFDTGGDFDAVNGIRGHGGAIDYGGAIVANGMLLVNSGSMRQGGNLLLAFAPGQH